MERTSRQPDGPVAAEMLSGMLYAVAFVVFLAVGFVSNTRESWFAGAGIAAMFVGLAIYATAAGSSVSQQQPSVPFRQSSPDEAFRRRYVQLREFAAADERVPVGEVAKVVDRVLVDGNYRLAADRLARLLEDV